MEKLLGIAKCPQVFWWVEVALLGMGEVVIMDRAGLMLGPGNTWLVWGLEVLGCCWALEVLGWCWGFEVLGCSWGLERLGPEMGNLRGTNCHMRQLTPKSL